LNLMIYFDGLYFKMNIYIVFRIGIIDCRRHF